MLRISQTCLAARDRMLKLILHAKSESLSFYRIFLPAQISKACGSSTTINSTCWRTQEDLSGRILKSLSSAFCADANGSCGKRLSLRSFTSCGEAQVKPRDCPSLIWSSIRPINGQITRITLFGYLPSQNFLKFFCSGFLFDRCGEQPKKKILTETGRHHCENISPFQ